MPTPIIARHLDAREILKQKSCFLFGPRQTGRDPKRAAKMRRGDRIAIKRMKGKAQAGIRILHLGIIKGVSLDTNCVICTVDWVATNLNRDIKSRGCFGSVHGPFKHDSWIQEIFCL